MDLVATFGREQRIVIWIIWLSVIVVVLLQPTVLLEYGADSVARGITVALSDTPGRELFPWWPRFRWRKHALAAYQRWKRAERQAWRAAQLARLVLTGAITFATIVDWLTKWQLRRQLGALPVLYAVLDVLQVQDIINRYCPNRRQVDNGRVALVLILNRLMSPRPLLWVADWVAKTVLVHRLGVHASKFNDDRLARTLDDLAPYCHDIWVEIVSVAMQHYDIDLSMIFYDLSAFVAHGDYAESDYVNFGFAHNTPSNKRKFKVGLDVTADGNIPVSYRLWPGSTADKATAQSNMEQLSRLLRAHGYKAHQTLVVGDRANLDDHLALVYEEKGCRYLAGLQPQKTVHRQLLKNVNESEFYLYPLTDEPGKQGYWGVSIDVPFEHKGKKITHRGLVVLSGPMRSAHAKTRAKQFRSLWSELRIIAEKASQNTARYRSAKAVLSIAQTRLRNSKVGKFVEIWTSGEKGNIQLHWRVKKEELIATMRQDSRYLLVTNDPDLTPKQMLAVYRQKDGVEKCFAVTKQDLVVSPIYLHKDDRIKAMLFINMLALLTYNILERQMRQHGLQMTTRRLIEQLGELSIIETHCWDGSITMRLTPITPEQMQLMHMMEIILRTPFTRVAELARIDGPSLRPPLLPSPSQPG